MPRKRRHQSEPPKTPTAAPTEAPATEPPGWARPAALAVIGLACLLTYWNSFDGQFLFDDQRFIIDNRDLMDMGRWQRQLLRSRRPVVNVSFGLNRAMTPPDTWDQAATRQTPAPFAFHATNLAIHTLAAFTLFGVVCGTLRHAPTLAALRAGAVPIAFMAALLWAVHPLQTQSVTYIIQRGESLMGLFYLLTLYCAMRLMRRQTSDRGWDAGAWLWTGAAFLCAVLGMGSKAVMVTAPLLVLLYDRAFFAGSFGSAFRRRWPLYALLALSWILLTNVLQGVLFPPETSKTGMAPTVGFGVPDVSPFAYLLTQVEVVTHYLRLSIAPVGQCLDYAWPIADTVGETLLSPRWIAGMLIQIVLIGATLLTFVFRPRWSFLGLWLLLILAPTSSFIPIRDAAFEHRMYLPLAAITTLAAILVYWIVQRALRAPSKTALGVVIVALILATPLATASASRNTLYADNDAMWRDVLAKAPNSARAHLNYGEALTDRAREQRDGALLAEAERHYLAAAELEPTNYTIWYNLGNIHNARARATDPPAREHFQSAINAYAESLKLNPRYPEARIMLGNIYSDLGRPPPLADATPEQVDWLRKAIEQYRVVADMTPRRWTRTLVARARFNLANQHYHLGELEEAAAFYQSASIADPKYPRARRMLAQIYDKWAQYDLAIDLLRGELEINPNDDESIRLLNQIERKREAP